MFFPSAAALKSLCSDLFVNENRTLLGTWTLDGNPDDVVKIPDAFLAHLNENGKLICPDTAIQGDQLTYISQADTIVLCLRRKQPSNR